MTGYILMALVTFALLLYRNRRTVFKMSMTKFDEGAFVILFLVLSLVWPLSLPVVVVVALTRDLMHYLMRGND